VETGAGDERPEALGAANAVGTTLRATPDRERVDEWLLVLTAEGFRAAAEFRQGSFVIRVPAAELEAAERVLEQYDAETVAALRRDPGPPPDRVREPDRFAAGVFALAAIAFFVWTGPRDPDVSWFARGSADADAILSGELWRTVTALTLHADWSHVLSNAVFGAIFLAAACAGFGPGVAVLLVLAAGSGGNLANAIFQGPGHASVGASTAVFGAVGLLGGRGVATRLRRGELGMRLWIPIAAGLALIAMVGTGERADVWAHLFGFLTGGFLGIPASLAWPGRMGLAIQAAALLAAVAAIVLSWRLALG
jgi:membrane associated rhomboid family serine protease